MKLVLDATDNGFRFDFGGGAVHAPANAFIPVEIEGESYEITAAALADAIINGGLTPDALPQRLESLNKAA